MLQTYRHKKTWGFSNQSLGVCTVASFGRCGINLFALMFQSIYRKQKKHNLFTLKFITHIENNKLLYAGDNFPGRMFSQQEFPRGREFSKEGEISMGEFSQGRVFRGGNFPRREIFQENFFFQFRGGIFGGGSRSGGTFHLPLKYMADILRLDALQYYLLLKAASTTIYQVLLYFKSALFVNATLSC